MQSNYLLKLSKIFIDVLSILFISYMILFLSGCDSNVGGSSNQHSQVMNQAINNNTMQQLADNFISKYKNESGLTGVSITAQCNGLNDNRPVTIFSGTFGHESQYQRAIKNDDLWSIGSNSKVFTAIVLIKLASESKYNFSLDDHIQKWITKDKYPELQQILRYNPTVRQILNMTSGVADGQNREALLYWFTHPYEYKTPSFWIGFANPESDVIPGTQWHYTDTNYQLADILVQQITNDTLTNEINQRIIRPLGLKNTVYVVDKTTDVVNPDRLVHTYYPFGNKIVDLYDWSLSNNAGAGSILANTEDMNTFYRALFTTNTLLTRKEFNEMNTLMDADDGKQINSPSDSKSGEAYGLGIFANNLNNFVNFYKISLAQYPNLQKDIANYNDIYMYPGATTMAFVQIYNVKTGATLMATYNSPNGPGLAPLIFPFLNYMDQVCH